MKNQQQIPGDTEGHTGISLGRWADIEDDSESDQDPPPSRSDEKQDSRKVVGASKKDHYQPAGSRDWNHDGERQLGLTSGGGGGQNREYGRGNRSGQLDRNCGSSTSMRVDPHPHPVSRDVPSHDSLVSKERPKIAVTKIIGELTKSSETRNLAIFGCGKPRDEFVKSVQPSVVDCGATVKPPEPPAAAAAPAALVAGDKTDMQTDVTPSGLPLQGSGCASSVPPVSTTTGTTATGGHAIDQPKEKKADQEQQQQQHQQQQQQQQQYSLSSSSSVSSSLSSVTTEGQSYNVPTSTLQMHKEPPPNYMTPEPSRFQQPTQYPLVSPHTIIPVHNYPRFPVMYPAGPGVAPIPQGQQAFPGPRPGVAGNNFPVQVPVLNGSPPLPPLGDSMYPMDMSGRPYGNPYVGGPTSIHPQQQQVFVPIPAANGSLPLLYWIPTPPPPRQKILSCVRVVSVEIKPVDAPQNTCGGCAGSTGEFPKQDQQQQRGSRQYNDGVYDSRFSRASVPFQQQQRQQYRRRSDNITPRDFTNNGQMHQQYNNQQNNLHKHQNNLHKQQPLYQQLNHPHQQQQPLHEQPHQQHYSQPEHPEQPQHFPPGKRGNQRHGQQPKFPVQQSSWQQQNYQQVDCPQPPQHNVDQQPSQHQHQPTFPQQRQSQQPPPLQQHRPLPQRQHQPQHQHQPQQHQHQPQQHQQHQHQPPFLQQQQSRRRWNRQPPQSRNDNNPVQHGLPNRGSGNRWLNRQAFDNTGADNRVYGRRASDNGVSSSHVKPDEPPRISSNIESLVVNRRKTIPTTTIKLHNRFSVLAEDLHDDDDDNDEERKPD